MPWEEDIAEEQRASSRETPGHDSEAPGAGAGIGVGAGAATVSGTAATPPPSSDGSAMDMFAGMSLVGSSKDLASHDHNGDAKPGKSKKHKKKKLKKRHSSKRVGVANADAEAGAGKSEQNAHADGGDNPGTGAVARRQCRRARWMTPPRHQAVAWTDRAREATGLWLMRRLHAWSPSARRVHIAAIRSTPLQG